MLRIRRPRAVLAVTASFVALAVVGVATLTGCTGAPPVSTVGAVEFEQPLAIPAIAPSRVENGVRVFDLTAQAGESEFRTGIQTPTWGFSQKLPRADVARSAGRAGRGALQQ